jgi:DNA-binding MarR family transcriptional regulator
MTFVEQVAQVRRTLYRGLTRRLALVTQRPFRDLLALRAISRHEVVTQVDLADRLLVDASAVSRLVDRLVKDGLLRRREGADRRSVRLELTTAAALEISRLDRALAVTENEVRGALTAREFEAALRVLAKLHGALGTSKTGAT